MVHLQLLQAATELTTPTIPFQDLSMELAVLFWVEPELGLFRFEPFQGRLPLTSERKRTRCCSDRNFRFSEGFSPCDTKGHFPSDCICCCVEMISTDFLPGANLEDGDREILLHSISRYYESYKS